MAAAYRLLGAPRLVTEGVERLLPASKPACLLHHLAVRADWVTRDALMLLFWPDSDESSARHTLRQLVYRARSLGWAPDLEVHDGRLRWLVETDVQRMRDALAAGDWTTVSSTYGGTFLDGVDLPDAPGFEAWRDMLRTELHERYLESAVNSAAALALRREHGTAIDTLRRALDRDPLAEGVLQSLLRCLAIAGQRTAAEALYTRFENDLGAQLGGTPDDATRALIATIRRGEPVAPRPHNLPSQTTRFVGREVELQALGQRLRRSDCRLLSLVGPGGIGKTRLALQAAADQIGAYRNGVYLVPVDTVRSDDGLASAIVEALHLPMDERGDPWSQLAAGLRERELLVVLDGLEQVRGAPARLVHLLTRVPDLTLLVTSREPLDLAVEWVFPLDGLELPTSGDAAFSEVGSLLLFEDAAQRVAPGFSLRDGHAAAAAKVCRLVAGVPLAIELAAGWTQLLTPAAIACEIERDLDFLRGTDRDRPERQQSLRAVFEAAWARLSDEERSVLVRTAVFAGDVDTAALGAVAGAALPTLLALVRRSLLRRNALGRFAMHELVRQYVRERLAAQADVADEVVARHLRYYADLVANWSYARDPAVLLASLRRDLGEIHQAWRNALARAEWDALEAMLTNLSLAHDLSARTERYLRWLEEALAALGDEPGRDGLRGRLQAQHAGCLHRLGRFVEAAEGVAASLPLLQERAAAVERCIALRVQGNIAYQRGDLRGAETSFVAALRTAESIPDERLVAGCHNNLGLLAKARGALDSALEHLEAAHAVAARCDDAICSQVLNNLATVHSRRGDSRRAEALLLESAAIKRRLGDERGLASNLTNLGNLRAHAGDRLAAERYHRESMRLAASIEDRVGVARAHTNLAELAVQGGDVARAIEHYAASVELKRANGEHGGVLEAYAGLVTCSLANGETDAARCWAADGWRYASRLDDRALVAPLRDACAPLVQAGLLSGDVQASPGGEEASGSGSPLDASLP